MASQRPAISSHSLGRAWVHDLPSKIAAAREQDLDLELFYEDLAHVAKSLPEATAEETNIIEAARIVRGLCDDAGLEIVCLQPFMHYEALRDRKKHAARIEEMKLWIKLVAILRINLIAIPSSFLPEDEVSGDEDLVVSDFRELVDLAPHVRFSFEALCWGTHINSWEQAWHVVQKVKRPNFGLCLDTFNMAGETFADPLSEDGKKEFADWNVDQSLQRLRTVDVEKIFFVQIVDAEKLDSPLTPSHNLYEFTQPSRMSWSRNCRLFYGEQDRGAYLPVKRILDTVFNDLEYRGHISAELFNACLTNPSDELPSHLAERAATSFTKLRRDYEANSHAPSQNENGQTPPVMV